MRRQTFPTGCWGPTTRLTGAKRPTHAAKGGAHAGLKARAYVATGRDPGFTTGHPCAHDGHLSGS